MSDVLTRLSEAGVSIWLDDLSRRRLVEGSLAPDGERPARRRGDDESDDPGIAARDQAENRGRYVDARHGSAPARTDGRCDGAKD